MFYEAQPCLCPAAQQLCAVAAVDQHPLPWHGPPGHPCTETPLSRASALLGLWDTTAAASGCPELSTALLQWGCCGWRAFARVSSAVCIIQPLPAAVTAIQRAPPGCYCNPGVSPAPLGSLHGLELPCSICPLIALPPFISIPCLPTHKSLPDPRSCGQESPQVNNETNPGRIIGNIGKFECSKAPVWEL